MAKYNAAVKEKKMIEENKPHACSHVIVEGSRVYIVKCSNMKWQFKIKWRCRDSHVSVMCELVVFSTGFRKIRPACTRGMQLRVVALPPPEVMISCRAVRQAQLHYWEYSLTREPHNQNNCRVPSQLQDR